MVRDEMVRVRAGRACDRRAELAGLLRTAGSLHLLGGGRCAIEAGSEHPGVARRLYAALGELGARGEVRLFEPARGHPRPRYVVRAEVSLQRLVEAGVLDESAAPSDVVPRRVVAKRCCVGAYLRGAFVARGSVSDPRRGAHLEIRSDSRGAAEELAGLLQRIGAPARVRAHRGGWAAYLKGGGPIGTALAAMSAHDAYLSWEAGSVWKSVHVEASRLANADAANARRLARAAVAQLAAIEAIDDGPGLRSLPPALREAAELRRAHRDASLEELGGMCARPVTKAAFAGRLRRIVRIARGDAPERKDAGCAR